MHRDRVCATIRGRGHLFVLSSGVAERLLWVAHDGDWGGKRRYVAAFLSWRLDPLSIISGYGDLQVCWVGSIYIWGRGKYNQRLQDYGS